MFKESNTLELKRKVTNDLKKEVIAFANTDGGTVLIGIDDDGKVIGLSDIDKEVNKVSSIIRDSIKPDLIMFVQILTEKYDGKKIIKIVIEAGEKKPYYIASKGMKSVGVFKRQGHSAVPVSEEQIRMMIRESDGVSYEGLRSLNQELTFIYCENQFYSRKLSFEQAQMKILGFVRLSENLFTNIGMLFSDQDVHTIKAAVFQGNTKSIFKDRKEFSGSILQQLEDVYGYIDMYNKTHAEINGLYREDKRDYPEVAIREILLNAIIHREYALSGSTLISIFDDRLEIVSLGGLVGGISVEDITYGISMTRNEKIANVFYRLNLVEAYGTGIGKAFESYDMEKRKPKIEVSDNVFKVTLFNRNYKEIHEVDLSDNQRGIMRLARQNGHIKRKDVEQLLGISQTMAGRILKQMVENKQLVKKGNGANTRYDVKI